QTKAMKKVAGTLKLDLAQYRELEAFSMFASDLDAASKRQLSRGERLMELLKQSQYNPYPTEHQVVSVWAGTNGHLDDIPVADVARFETEFIDHVSRTTDVLTTVRETGKLDDDSAETLKKSVDDFKAAFQTSEAEQETGGESAEAVESSDVDQ